jgi:hypothetical protein
MKIDNFPSRRASDSNDQWKHQSSYILGEAAACVWQPTIGIAA